MKRGRFVLWIIAVLLFVLAFLPVQLRWDATSAHRYSLRSSAKNFLKTIKTSVQVKVYLAGAMPADFQRLARETSFFLNQIHQENGKIEFSFVNPAKAPNAEAQMKQKGMLPALIPSIDGNKMEQTLVYPYAEISANGQSVVVDLMKGSSGEDLPAQTLSAENLLQYNLLSGISAVSTSKKKRIGILVNQDELRPQEFQDFLQMARVKYSPSPIIPQNGKELTFNDMSQLEQADLLVIAKPRKPFTATEKQVLDQYIVQGGRTLWMMEPVSAEMDSLFRSKEIVAVPNDVNLTDFFFNYGVRLGSMAVKDRQKAANIRLVVGEINGNPQYETFSWPYFPVAAPIAAANSKVKLQFPGNVELMPRPELSYQPLLKSSGQTTLKKLPNPVSLNELANADSLGRDEVRAGEQLFGVKISGKFKSAFANRIERKQIPNFQAQGGQNQMIILADGDVARNSVVRGKPLPMAQDILSDETFDNRAFIEDILADLLGDSQLLDLKNKVQSPIKLDREKLNANLWLYRLTAIGFPVILFILAGFASLNQRRSKRHIMR